MSGGYEVPDETEEFLTSLQEIPLPPEAWEAEFPTKEWEPSDQIRGWIVLSLLGTLAFLVVFGLMAAVWGPWSAVERYLQLVVPVVTTLLGSVVGFYFGTKAGGKDG